MSVMGKADQYGYQPPGETADVQSGSGERPERAHNDGCCGFLECPVSGWFKRWRPCNWIATWTTFGKPFFEES